jgi:L-ribulose-5-phosphate 3-epimerase
MGANWVAREVGFAMHGWGHGDRATNDAFRPLDTFASRFGALLADVRALGFDAVDVWGAHLNPAWATDRHVELASGLLDEHGLRVASYEVFVGAEHLERTCEIARALGTGVVAGSLPLEDSRLVPLLDARGLRFGLENHPEKTPRELRARLPDGVGACVDTGWFATQGHDPASALEELRDRLVHVHLKDVLAAGEPHETCRWGEGIVDVEACVRTLQRLGYEGGLSIEHEPEEHDPAEECRAMREELEGWLA